MFCARFVFLAIVSATTGQAEPPSPSTAAATVNGKSILSEEVQASVTAALRGRAVDAHRQQALEATALERLIDRTLVLQALATIGIQVTDRQFAVALEKFHRQLDVRGSSLDAHLSDHALTLPMLKAQLRWQLAWEQYLQKELTEDRLEDFYKRHRRLFDGTELRASQIFLPFDSDEARNNPLKLKDELAEIRKQIVGGKIKFEDAAKKLSKAPSAATGGDVGFFPRRGVMANSFADAAFALEVGQISQPVLSPLGAHLIKVTSSRPGDKQLAQAREEVRAAAAKELFTSLANQQRKTAKIAYTGRTAYYKPGTRQLVLPNR